MSSDVRVHNVSFSRDNLIQTIIQPNFFERNPALEMLEASIKDGVEKYRESGRKAGCGCRADVSLIFPALDNLLLTLEQFKETNPAAVTTFAHYAANIPENENERVALSIYFRKSGEANDIKRYEFT
jgi:hypothetical protein